MYKFLVLAAVAAVAQAGLISTYGAAPIAYGGIASPAIGSSSQSTLRSLDGASAISQYSKAVDTAFSSVRKTDTRITNDARILAPAYAAAPVAYASPAIAHGPVAYAAPAAYATHGAVVGPAVARAGLLGVAYSAAPAVAHVTYDSPITHYVL